MRFAALRAAPEEGGDMTATSLTDTDLRARDAVVRRLDWDPDVDSSAVGVTAKNGVVTLTGFIDSYSGKLAAERAAKRVGGVRAVANDIQVRLKLERTDADVARDVARALELRIGVPETVQAVVHNGHVTLTGKVSWSAQKKSAARAVTRVRGVRGIFNHIEVAPDRTEREVRRRVAEAMHHADVDARRVSVAVSGEVALLTGTVGSWPQREVAEHAAAAAPGIRWVDNRIAIESSVPAEEPEDC
jgi:osmotically-inducible protein OsmY